MPTYKKLIIGDIRRETTNCVSILFTIPEELQPHYQYIAGQYVTLRLTLDGQEIRRAYSICSSPKSGELRIAVKAVKNGVFSEFATSRLKIGDCLEVSKPEGRFTIEPNIAVQNNYAAFVAGSGITPVMSILKSVLEAEPKSTFLLVYGNKSVEETIFYEELHDLQQKYIGRLLLQFVFSNDKKDTALEGRIDKKVVDFVLETKFAQLTFSSFYLCGPEAMITIVSNSLKEKNVSEEAIKMELFTTKEIENSTKPTIEGHSTITIMVDDEEATFEMTAKETILDAALKNGIDAPYSCQGGICSSCLAKVTKGSATMVKNNILSAKEAADGLILTCQAHPTSAEIYVDFDAV